MTLDRDTAVKLWEAFVDAGYDAQLSAARPPVLPIAQGHPPPAVARLDDEADLSPSFTVRVSSPGRQLGIDVLDIARDHGVSLQTSDALLG